MIPEMNAWQQKYKDDLVIVGISDEPKETLQKFMLNTDMTYTVATDPLQRMKSKVGVTGIPHVLIISADNIVRWQGYPIFIDDRLTENVLSQIIEESKKRYPLSFQTQDRSKFVNVSALRTDFCQTLARKLTQSWQASSIDRSAPADFTLQIGKLELSRISMKQSMILRQFVRPGVLLKRQRVSYCQVILPLHPHYVVFVFELCLGPK
ncbi:MAG: TlpA family protein disulfide reductase [Candidatus Obscuribacter sp.]|nr:TlpA family protein disulfide reductase [Candidatus Obscuribacter sp.]